MLSTNSPNHTAILHMCHRLIRFSTCYHPTLVLSANSSYHALPSLPSKRRGVPALGGGVGGAGSVVGSYSSNSNCARPATFPPPCKGPPFQEVPFGFRPGENLTENAVNFLKFLTAIWYILLRPSHIFRRRAEDHSTHPDTRNKWYNNTLIMKSTVCRAIAPSR